MREKQIPGFLFLLASTLVAGVLFAGPPPDLKLQAQLIWGTDDSKPPEGKNYKPADINIVEHLQGPLKWKHYFEVSRTNFMVAPTGLGKVAVSPKCELEVKSLGNTQVEVVLYGKGKEAARQKRPLTKGQLLVLSGNAPNSTAWLVVLKRIE
jgi:hypothetical protein